MVWVLVAVAIGFALWSRWLIRTRRWSRGWYAPVALATLAVPALALATVFRLVSTFDDLGATAASDKASALANGIAGAMLATAIALAILAVWLVVLAIATLASRRRP